MSIVNLPGGSPPPPSFDLGTRFGWDARFEFRTEPADPNALLLRAFQKDSDGTSHYSESAFVLECAEGVRVRPASDQDWRRATLVELPDRAHQYAQGRDDQAGFSAFNGKEYKRSGKAEGTDLLVSPRHRRLAILSFDRVSSQGNFGLQPFTYFLEIYDIASGNLLSSAEGYVSSLHISQVVISQELFWVGDRYFYMPMSAGHGKLLFFDFGPGL